MQWVCMMRFHTIFSVFFFCFAFPYSPFLVCFESQPPKILKRQFKKLLLTGLAYSNELCWYVYVIKLMQFTCMHNWISNCRCFIGPRVSCCLSCAKANFFDNKTWTKKEKNRKYCLPSQTGKFLLSEICVHVGLCACCIQNSW